MEIRHTEVQIPRLRWLDGYSQHAYFDSAIGKSTFFYSSLIVDESTIGEAIKIFPYLTLYFTPAF